jgi:hypothetical protein
MTERGVRKRNLKVMKIAPKNKPVGKLILMRKVFVEPQRSRCR